MSVNIYAKQVALIHADYTLEKASEKFLVQKKEETTILQLALL